MAPPLGFFSAKRITPLSDDHLALARRVNALFEAKYNPISIVIISADVEQQDLQKQKACMHLKKNHHAPNVDQINDSSFYGSDLSHRNPIDLLILDYDPKQFDLQLILRSLKATNQAMPLIVNINEHSRDDLRANIQDALGSEATSKYLIQAERNAHNCWRQLKTLREEFKSSPVIEPERGDIEEVSSISSITEAPIEPIQDACSSSFKSKLTSCMNTMFCRGSSTSSSKARDDFNSLNPEDQPSYGSLSRSQSSSYSSMVENRRGGPKQN